MGKCLEVNQGVTLKVALEGLFGDPLDGKKGRKDTKIGSMSRRKGNLALEKGYFKRIGQCLVLWGVIILTKGTRNLNGGTRRWSICVGW